MRDHRRTWVAGSFVVVSGGLIACVGGGGGLSADLDSWESPPRSSERPPRGREAGPHFLERAKLSAEAPSRSPESAPGVPGVGGSGTNAVGSTGFDCSGTYVCQEAGKTKTETITLTTAGGRCSVEGVVIEPDGKLSSEGKTVGSWYTTPTGFTVVTGEDTIHCVKGAAGPSSSSGGTSEAPPTRAPSPLDAG